MAIFNSYVKLPEGKAPQSWAAWCAPHIVVPLFLWQLRRPMEPPSIDGQKSTKHAGVL
jgi:hypothetical protein